MDYTSLRLHLCIFKYTPRQIGQVQLMIVTLQPATVCFLALIFSHGVPVNSLWLQDPQPKQSIVPSLMHQLKYHGYVLFFQNLEFLLSTHLSYGVTIKVLVPWLLIRYFIPERSILKWMSIMFVSRC